MLKKLFIFGLLALVLVGSFTLAGTMLRYKLSLPAAVNQLLAQLSSPSVTSFSLINADTDQVIAGFDPLKTETTINLATLPTRKINIRANTNPYALGSVRFSYDTSSSFKLQDIPPYAIGGASPAGDYYAWTPTVGDHTLKVTPYTGKGGTGTAGTALTVNFKVIDTPAPSNNFKVSLINTDTQNAVTGFNPILDGVVIDMDKTGRNLNFLVQPSSAEPLAKVQFDYDGTVNYRTESEAPLTFAGDKGVGNLLAWTPALGDHTLTITPFTQANGVYIAGTPKVIHFTAIKSTVAPPPPPPSGSTAPARIGDVYLYNAETLTPVTPITLGPLVDINLWGLPTRRLNIKVEAPSDVTQIRFTLDGANYNTDTAAPFYMAASSAGWTPSVGRHTLVITPYNMQQGTLTAGTPTTITFTVVDTNFDTPPPPPPPPPGAPRINIVSLVNATNQTSVSGFDPFANGVTINLAALPTRSLNVKAVASSDTTNVTFTLDGQLYRSESSAPFYLAGSTGTWTPTLGSHTLVVTPIRTSSTGQVTTGTPTTINFTVTDLAVIDPPTLILSSTPLVQFNGSVTVTWSSTNANRCAATGDWTGPQALSGSITFSNITTNKTFTLACSGERETVTRSSISVVMVPPPPPVPTVAGYTDISPKADSRVVYVSNSSGNDSNPGTQDSPVKTVGKAMTMVRDGFPDQILLKKGDTWTGSIQNFINTGDDGISGRSNTERFVLSSYGTGERPIVYSPDGQGSGIFLGYKTRHMAIVGIHFKGNNKGDGINLEGTTKAAQDIVIEDCYLELYRNGIDISARYGTIHGPTTPTMIKDIIVRRNIVVDNYQNGSRPQGAYFYGINGLTIEENVFDNNGRRPDGGGGTVFDHNVYIHGMNWNTVVRNNIMSNAASDALQARAGGIVEGNFFYNNPIHMTFGYVNGGGEVHPGGVTGSVKDNVMIKTRDINAGPNAGPRGYGIQVANVASASITDNILAFNTSNLTHGAFFFEPGTGDYAAQAIGIHNINIERNIVFQWPVALYMNGFGLSALNQWSASAVNLRDNYLGGLVKRSSVLNFPFGAINAPIPTTIDLTPNFDPFIAQARLLSKDSWNADYTAQAAVRYVKTKFGR